MFLKQAINLGGREFTIETGRIAKQADGAVLVRQGETIVLVTAVSARQPKEKIREANRERKAAQRAREREAVGTTLKR